jgi:hypothetical protein
MRTRGLTENITRLSWQTPILLEADRRQRPLRRAISLTIMSV